MLKYKDHTLAAIVSDRHQAAAFLKNTISIFVVKENAHCNRHV